MLVNKNREPRAGIWRVLCGLMCVALAAAGCGQKPRRQDGDFASQVTNSTPSDLVTNSHIASTNLGQEAEFDIDKSTEHLTRGNELLASGRVEEAVEQFALAVRFNPEDEDLYYNLALAQARAGDTESAKNNYAKALEVYPDYVEAHNNLGNLLVNESKFEEAIGHFRKALEHEPGNASAHNNLGNAYARQKRYADSLAHFQTAVELNADYPEAQFNLGNAYLLLGRVDQAIGEFTKLLRLHPEFSRARLQLDKALAAKRGQTPPTH
jgi:tetratricopeptide (TPR) repeat protein